MKDGGEDSVTTTESSDRPDGVDLLFDGSINLWRIRVNLDISIIDHTDVKVIEVVGYHPELDKESRLYLNRTTLLSKIKTEDQEKSISQQRDEAQRWHKHFDVSAYTKHFETEFIVQYVTNRVNALHPTSADTYQVALTPHFGDVVKDTSNLASYPDGKVLDIVLEEPPKDLHPYHTHHLPKVASNVVLSAIASLNQEQRSLAGFTKAVDKIVTNSSALHQCSRNSVLLKSIDDSCLMECTNFFNANSTPELFGILNKHHVETSSNSKSGSSKNTLTKLQPIPSAHPIHAIANDASPNTMAKLHVDVTSAKPQAQEERGKSHGGHIHGMKLLHKVGSFKFSADSEHTYANAMLSPHIEVSLSSQSLKHVGSKPEVLARYLTETKSSKKKQLANNNHRKPPALPTLLKEGESKRKSGKGTPKHHGGESEKKKEGKEEGPETNQRSSSSNAIQRPMTHMRYRKAQSEGAVHVQEGEEKESSVHKRFDGIRSISHQFDMEEDVNKESIPMHL